MTKPSRSRDSGKAAWGGLVLLVLLVMGLRAIKVANREGMFDEKPPAPSPRLNTQPSEDLAAEWPIYAPPGAGFAVAFPAKLAMKDVPVTVGDTQVNASLLSLDQKADTLLLQAGSFASPPGRATPQDRLNFAKSWVIAHLPPEKGRPQAEPTRLGEPSGIVVRYMDKRLRQVEARCYVVDDRIFLTISAVLVLLDANATTATFHQSFKLVTAEETDEPGANTEEGPGPEGQPTEPSTP